MRRRPFQCRILPAFLAALTLAGIARTAAAQEPTYTVTLPGKQVIHLQVQARTGRRGPQMARIFTTPVSPLSPDPSKKSALTLDAMVAADPQGNPLRATLAFGGDAQNLIRFEGRRLPEGTFRVAIPEERGTLTFGAPLVTNLTAQLFLGRLYNWDKGGDQNFALLVDYGWSPLQITTLKVMADGKETIELADGKTEARKLRFEAVIPFLGKEAQKGVFYIGPLGEILRCDSAVLGLPFKLRGPAKREEAKRLIVTVALPTDRLKVTLQAERVTDGYEVTLHFNDNIPAKALTGLDYIPTHIESAPIGRALTATVSGNQLQYVLAEAMPEIQTYNTNRPWFAPYWLVTSLWESQNAPFGGMAVGEKRDGDLPPKIAGLLQDNTFTLERLPDTSAELSGQTFPVRRYRMTTEKSVTDLYTDGSRLIACLNSDNLTIVRDGWEQWASAQKPPDAPTQKQEKKPG